MSSKLIEVDLITTPLEGLFACHSPSFPSHQYNMEPSSSTAGSAQVPPIVENQFYEDASLR